MPDIETTLCCRTHGDLYEVQRVPVPGQDGHFHNQIMVISSGSTVTSAKICPTCEAPLVRKELMDAP